MKKLAAKKNIECMACLQCAQACAEAFYKEFDITKSCIQIVAGKNGVHTFLAKVKSALRSRADQGRT